MGSIGNFIGSLIGLGSSGMGGGGSSPYVGSADAAFYHSGGIVGGGRPTRRVAVSSIADLPRFHGGGIVGLAQDEVLSVMRKREEVLTEADPRHTYNLARGGAAASAAPVRPVTNVNILPPAGHEVTHQSQAPNASGGMDVRVEIGRAVAGEMQRRGSPVQKAMANNYLAEPTIRMR